MATIRDVLDAGQAWALARSRADGQARMRELAASATYDYGDVLRAERAFASELNAYIDERVRAILASSGWNGAQLVRIGSAPGAYASGQAGEHHA